MQFTITSIGSIKRTDENVQIILEPAYRMGLKGIDGHSHIVVIWWAVNNDIPAKRATLLVHSRPLPEVEMGVFATRSPRRPNLVMSTACRLLSMDEKKGILTIENIDAFDGTPVVDIKCYSPGIDRVMDEIKAPWPVDYRQLPEGGVGPH